MVSHNVLGESMQCEVHDRLEKDLLRIREEGTRLSMARKLTDDEVQRLFLDEDKARSRLVDHRSEHGCKTPGE